MSFFNKDGDIPEGVCCWQFNFKFNLSEVKIKETKEHKNKRYKNIKDMYAEESVDLLLKSGLHFDRHEREGIEPIHFAEILLVSGTTQI